MGPAQPPDQFHFVRASVEGFPDQPVDGLDVCLGLRTDRDCECPVGMVDPSGEAILLVDRDPNANPLMESYSALERFVFSADLARGRSIILRTDLWQGGPAEISAGSPCGTASARKSSASRSCGMPARSWRGPDGFDPK